MEVVNDKNGKFIDNVNFDTTPRKGEKLIDKTLNKTYEIVEIEYIYRSFEVDKVRIRVKQTK